MTTDQGNTITSYFCKDCSTTLWEQSSGFPGMKLIKEGAMMELSQETPDIEYYTKHRAAWLEKVAGAEQKETG